MRSSSSTLIPWLITAAAGLGLAAAYATRQEPRSLGDLAVVGDEVVLPVERFQLPAEPFQLPAGIGGIAVRVVVANVDTLQGPVVAYVTTGGQRVAVPAQAAAAFGTQTVYRNAIAAISRDGTPVVLG